MQVRWVPTLAGLAIAFALLAFVTKISIFGATCYAVGEVNVFGNMYCLKPLFYWAAWIFAVVLLLIGVRVPGRPAQQPSSPQEQAELPDDSTGNESIAERVRRTLILGGVLLLAVLVIVGGYTIYRYFTERQPAPVEAPATDRAAGPPAAPASPMTNEQSPPSDQVAPPPLPPETPAPPSVPLPVPGRFRWSGRAVLPDGGVYSVAVIFDPSGNGAIEWADLKCGGVLTFARTQGESFEYNDQITYGVRDCMQPGTVVLTPLEGGAALQLVKDTGTMTITAEMRPF